MHAIARVGLEKVIWRQDVINGSVVDRKHFKMVDKSVKFVDKSIKFVDILRRSVGQLVGRTFF